MLFSTVLTQIFSRTTTMLPGTTDGRVTINVFFYKILPICVLFSLSVMLGNQAYLYLSVSFIQVKLIQY
jgi:hypothetical protein